MSFKPKQHCNCTQQSQPFSQPHKTPLTEMHTHRCTLTDAHSQMQTQRSELVQFSVHYAPLCFHCEIIQKNLPRYCLCHCSKIKQHVQMRDTQGQSHRMNTLVNTTVFAHHVKTKRNVFTDQELLCLLMKVIIHLMKESLSK